MKRIIIIGGGFAGLSAVFYLRKFLKQVEVVLIDKKKEFTFLPLLPDTISRRVETKFLSLSLDTLSKKLSFNFINNTVKSIDLDRRKVCCQEHIFEYDYLINASGSKTNFYANQALENNARKLDDIDDGLQILKDLDSDNFNVLIVGGGGYTGIETPTNLWR